MAPEKIQKKTHPYLVPYNELLYEQRVKNELFLAIVRYKNSFCGINFRIIFTEFKE